jgi:hypothetical protein
MGQLTTGITLSFPTSNFTCELISIQPPGPVRKSIDMTHHESSHMEFSPGDLVDWGELRLRIAFEPDTAPPISGVTEAVVINFPDSGTSTWTVDAFFTNYEPADMPVDERMEASVTLKCAGAVVVT